MKKLISTLLFSLMALSLSLAGVSAADFENQSVIAEAYALDTIAGYSTVLRTSKLSPGAKVKFAIKKPSNEVVYVDSTVNDFGVAIADLSDYHTKMAGDYQIKLSADQGNFYSPWNEFEVFAGNVSVNKSTISPVDYVAKAGEAVKFSVKLVDDYGNAVSGHKMKLISDAGNESIKSIGSGVSDASGMVQFEVSSVEDGLRSYSVYDLTADEVLATKSRVVFLGSGSGNFLQTSKPFTAAAVGNASGTVDSLEFELPETVRAGDSVSITLKAVDEMEQVVMNYNGEVRFSVAGDNAAYVDLPEDYTFTAEDQGEHTFSLAFNFSRPGTYELRATDLDNLAIFASETVEVSESGSLSENVQSRDVRISDPLPGTYGSNIQVIKGKAEPGSGLKIFDNQVEIASLVAGLEGNFTYTTGALADGEHVIYVAVVNELGTIIDISESVTINIDTEAPEVEEITFDPEGAVIPGSPVIVKVKFAEALSNAALLVADKRVNLEKNAEGYYQGAFAAPIEFGEYAVDLDIIDELGNRTKIEKAATVTVAAIDMEEKAGPAVVQGLVARAEDRRVILNWNAVTDSPNPLARYRVYYGLSPSSLTEAVDTFTTANTWYVPNLVNGQTYYFAVVAVDSRSNSSENFSNIVEATPRTLVVEMPSVDVMEGSGGSEALEDMEGDVSDTGPGMWGLMLASALGGYFYTRSARRRRLNDCILK